MQRKTTMFGNKLFVLIFLSVGLFSASTVFSASVRWRGYDEGISLGKQQNKKIFLFFWVEWCKYCEKMEKDTLNKPEIASYLNESFIPVKVNTDTEQDVAIEYFVRGLPTSWFVGEKGEKISNLPGYVSPEMFLPILKYIHSDSYKKMSFKDFLNDKQK
jgi:thioredoxin-related protein